MTSPEMTVGDLIDLLSGCDRSAPVRQAMNPFFPMAHRLAQVLQSVDETGRTVVYLAEGAEPDDRQARPAQAGERVGDDVVEASIVTG